MLKKTLFYIVIPSIALFLTVKIFVFLQDKFISNSTTKTSESEALIGGSFSLTNQDGKIVKDTDFRGKHMLVYFGFTNCPMICPTDMATISQALQEIGSSASHIQPLFITIDPQRDTSEQIKTFLSNFHPSFQGLTGTAEQIAAAANAYKVFYKKAKADDLQEYLMNHSAYIYLMGRDGKYITHFRHDQPIEEIVAGLKKRV